MLMMAIGTISIGPTGLNLTVVPRMTGTLTIGSASAGRSLIVVRPTMAVTGIGSAVVGLTLTAVPSMAGTRMIGSGAAGPSLTALPPLAGTLMTGNAVVGMVLLGGRGKFSEIQQSIASSTSTTHCGGPLHED
jgi:hypothetical protein